VPAEVLALVLGRSGIRPGPDEARRWVGEELDKAAYQEGLVERLRRWLDELLTRLQIAAEDAGSLSTAAAVLLAVLLLALGALLVSRVRREPTGPNGGDAPLGPAGVDADEHRRTAERALEQGELDRAVVEAFRAIAVRAVQRGVLVERPDLTAHELAAELGPRFPDQALALERAAALFDQVFYGDQQAAAQDARALLGLDGELARARPRVPGETPTAAGSAVPR
jgi:hypothetical protein